MPLNKVVGLDLGSANIRAVEVELNKDGTIKKIEKIAEIRIPTQIIDNGALVSPRSFVKALKDLFSKNDIKTKDVVISVNGKNIFTRNIRGVPTEKDEETFAKTLPYSIESVPIEVPKNYLGYHTIAEYLSPDERKRLRDILLVAIEKENLNSILKAVQEAGLKPRVVDITPLSLIRSSILNTEGSDTQKIALIDIGADVISIIIYQDGEPEYLRTITGAGGNIINSRISTDLHIPRDDAEQEKFKALGRSNVVAQNTSSVFGDNTIPGIQPGTKEARIAQAINLIVAQEVSVIISQVRDTFTDAITFHNDTVDSPIDKIVLSGAGAGINTLAARLENEIEIPVEYINPFKIHNNKEIMKKIESNEIIPHTFSTALGSVIREDWK